MSASEQCIYDSRHSIATIYHIMIYPFGGREKL